MKISFNHETVGVGETATKDKFDGFAKVNYANDDDTKEWTDAGNTSFTSPFICIDTDDADDIKSKLNLLSANNNVEAMPGCGLAVLDVGTT